MIDWEHNHVVFQNHTSISHKWNWQNGGIATAHISYNSTSRRLSVASSYSTSPVTITYDIDLHTILLQWVRVGF